MADEDVVVKGLDKLNELLQQLAPKIERNIMRGALRAGMKEVQKIAKESVSIQSGQLRDGLVVGTRAAGSSVTSNLKATGPHRSIAHLVEFGTAPHVITGKNGGSLKFGGGHVRSVLHPGAQLKPFMRPALDGGALIATIAAGDYIKARLQSKEGLDTSHIFVEGDEI